VISGILVLEALTGTLIIVDLRGASLSGEHSHGVWVDIEVIGVNYWFTSESWLVGYCDLVTSIVGFN
jgi:hypothetical protein